MESKEEFEQLPQSDVPRESGPRAKSSKLWGKLKKFLLKKDEFALREQLYLNLIPRNQLRNEILEYSIDNICVQIHQQKSTISLEEAKKFNSEKVDSTGISLWPAEELLAYFCSKNIQLFSKYKNIAEFGAGYSGLAGLTLAKLLIQADHTNFNLEISDGNDLCSQLLSKNIKLNDLSDNDNTINSCVHSCQRIWGQSEPPSSQFDCILIADCLFFRNYHNALIETIMRDLSPINGICLIIAPSRSGTLKEFLAKCEGKLDVEAFEFNDGNYEKQKEFISNRIDYSPDMHDYFFFKLRIISS